MTRSPSVDDLTGPELDALYIKPREALPSPTGVWDGVVVARVDAPGARRPLPRVAQWLGFEVTRWGIDFDVSRWWFVHPSAKIGRFRTEVGPSRWRSAEVLQLHYDVSRLPIRHRLYDELRPLSADLILGLGGENAPVGEGDHFWFTLRPR